LELEKVEVLEISANVDKLFLRIEESKKAKPKIVN